MEINRLAQPQPESRLSPKQLDDIRKTAKEFEGMFMTEMFNHMFSGIETDPMFGGGQGEQMFRGLMVQEYGKMIAKTPNGMGLSDMIQKQMIAMQEAQIRG
jgi:Rod binding domain-containing protein